MNDQLRLVGISTSPRKNANTGRMVSTALRAGEELAVDFGFSVDIDLISLAGKKILPCYNEDLCIKQKDYCKIDDDWLSLVNKLIDPPPNGLVFGSPVYFFNQNSIGRAFMERCTCLLKGIWESDFPYHLPDFSKTAAGAVAVGADRHGGIEHTMSTIIHWLLIMGFVTVGGFYIGAGGWAHEDEATDAIKNDNLGLESASLVGKKVAKTAALLKKGAEFFEEDELPFLLWKGD